MKHTRESIIALIGKCRESMEDVMKHLTNTNQIKYELTSETVKEDGKILHRIHALIDIGNIVKAGDLGGFIEKESNLSHNGDCWIHMGACASGNSHVSGNAQVRDNACIRGNACISDNALICGTVLVDGNALICDNAQASDNALICDEAVVCGEAIVTENATVCDQAVISGEACISGEARISGNARRML